MVRLLVATVSWHKSLQFVQKSNITLLSGLFMILLAVSIIILRLGIKELRFCVVFSPPSFISYASHEIVDTDTSEYLPFIKIFVYVQLKILKNVLSSLILFSAAAKQLKAVVASTLLKFLVFRQASKA